MLCACSGEQFKFEAEDAPQSPESLATRDFSASGFSSRATGDWDSKVDDIQVDEAESTLKEALSLNYEEARALLGRLEYQRGNYDAALQVFQGIDIVSLTPRMTRAVVERTRPLRKHRSKGEKADSVPPPGLMSLHSISLLLEAILLKAKSLEELGHCKEAAKECKIILDIVESGLPNGMPEGFGEDCKLQEMFHKALELLPHLWIKAGLLEEAIIAYRRALVKPWNLDPKKVASVQRDLAVTLLYGGVEARLPPELKVWGPIAPKDNVEEAILLLLILMEKVASKEMEWDAEIMDHLTYALSVTGQFELLAEYVEQALPGIYNRAERWYILALCYSAAGQNEAALNLLKKDQVSRGVIQSTTSQKEHFLAEAYKFLGICYGNVARKSISDTERVFFQKEALESLNCAFLNEREDPEMMYYLGLEHAVQRNVEAAFDYAIMYSDTVAGNSGRGWKLLALILSADQRLKDAQSIVDFSLDEAGSMDQLELLRLKAVLQIAQEQPKQAIGTYRILLAMIQAQRELHSKNFHKTKYITSEAPSVKNLEIATWQDLATIYMKLGSLPDAEICTEKAKSIEFYSPGSWHTTGMLFEAQSQYKEALVSFSISLAIEPDYIPSIISTAEILMKLGRQSMPIARSFLMNALRLEPTNHDAWMNLGLISKMEGSLQQAADYFQAAYELKLSAPVQSFV
ncbi:hypothetical protein CISIN_1g005603mg [Citrus sinensis]|uniref:Uncharacterized protein n=1 Tax=Citrus sinensis TaxID=2711 RepID=A0A067H1Q3_CITSI|nr:hypothetical protein CISIN_1g005603mg [Citrus sinensis]